MKRLYKNRFDRKFLGVFGGLGLVLKIDSNILRLIFVFLMATPLFPLLGTLYILMGVLVPEGGPVMIENPAKKLFRSLSDRKIGGLCGGLGKYMRFDSTVIRLIIIIVAFTTLFVPIIVTYVASIILLPEGE
jgi:phage shock protein C